MVTLCFTPCRNSIAASAVCAFNLSAITHVFSGPFKYQENSRSAWLPYPNPKPDFQVKILENPETLSSHLSVLICNCSPAHF